MSPIVRAEPGSFDDIVEKIAQKHVISTAVVLIRWALLQGIAVVTTSMQNERMKDHLLAQTVSLSEDEGTLIIEVGSARNSRRWNDIFAADDEKSATSTLTQQPELIAGKVLTFLESHVDQGILSAS